MPSEINQGRGSTNFPVVVNNFPAVQTVSGNVTIASGIVSISGGVSCAQSGTWTIQQGTPPWDVNATKWGGTVLTTAAALADGVALPTAPMIGSVNLLYDGTNLNLQRGTQDVASVIALTTHSGTVTTNVQTNYNARGIIVYVNITVAPGGTLTLSFFSNDPQSGGGSQLNPTGVTVAATGVYSWILCPGIVETAFGAVIQRVAVPLPHKFQIQTVTSSGTWTYSVSYTLIN